MYIARSGQVRFTVHDQVHVPVLQSSLKILTCHTRECEIVLPRCWRVYAALLSGFTF